MFINFWYVAGLASEFTDQPLKRRMLGQDFVVFHQIPTPAPMALLGLGLLGIAAMGRRNEKRSHTG